MEKMDLILLVPVGIKCLEAGALAPQPVSTATTGLHSPSLDTLDKVDIRCTECPAFKDTDKTMFRCVWTEVIILDGGEEKAFHQENKLCSSVC